MTRFAPDPSRLVKPPPRSKNRRRNDGPWRAGCLTLRGGYCRACGPFTQFVDSNGHPCGRRLEVDHIWPRSQGGPSVVENGLVLCVAHHADKTASRIVIDPAWLDPDQVAWLADAGWVAWDGAGQPHGRGWKHFGAQRSGPTLRARK